MRLTLLLLCMGALLGACASVPSKGAAERTGTAGTTSRKAGFGKGGAFVK